MEKKYYTINQREVHVVLRDDADESVAAEIFKLREYRVAEDFISKTNLPIFDVGAHAGFFTLYARTLNAKVPIIAIEPEPGNIQAFEENIKSNHIKNVTLIAGALGNKIGKRPLQLSADSHNHSLIGGKTGRVILVKGHTLNSLKKYWPQGIGLLKMDVEGGEYEVFENLKPEEFSLIHAFVMEYHDLPNKKHYIIETILRENGFGVQTFPSKFDKTMGFLWATNKRLPKRV